MNRTKCVSIVAARSNLLCEKCGAMGTNTHHRKNRSQGGQWSPDNCLRLCGSGTTGCHGQITEFRCDDDMFAMGWAVKSFDDPGDIPVKVTIGWVYLTETGDYVPCDPAVAS